MVGKTDEAICPLCHQHNQCAVNAADGCWCTRLKVPNELISKVPEKLQGKSCICQACVEKFNVDNAYQVN